ncbi:MAG: UDP-N-acetylmuramoyl-tripeptide--D-alanyl-D-alanine ligase [Anaerolineae bacterium]
MNVLVLLVLAIWIAGALIRIYRQARFFQIEEYMNLRYLRWALSIRHRWLPTRPVVSWLIGCILAIVFSEGGVALPFIVAGAAALIAAIPPDEGEVKKRFRATGRAKRLLVASMIPAAMFGLILALVAGSAFGPAGRAEAIALAVAATMGLVLLLAAPLWLVLGNLLMMPVEATLRRRYLRRAQRVLDEIRPTVIGITGSYGKTSTKAILAHLLNGRFKAYPTPKSYNTLMGISMSINNDLAEDRSVDYFICEMGAYIPGEIQRIADLVHPTIGIEIEVGPQHLERFGSLENVAIAKYELVKALPPDGIACFNMDNEYVRGMAERDYPATRIGISKTANPSNPPPGVHLVASDVRETLDGLRFTLTDTRTGASTAIETPLLGEHNVTNLLLAAAVSLHEGMTLSEIARRARTLQPAESRLVRQTTPSGITIINDAYSANPVGIVGALNVLALHDTGRRLLITPGMVELAERHDEENRRLGELAARKATDVILVGAARTAPIREGLLAAGFPEDHLLTVEALREAVQWYEANLKAGDTVMFLNDLPDTYNT